MRQRQLKNEPDGAYTDRRKGLAIISRDQRGDSLQLLIVTCSRRVCGAMVARLTSIVIRYQKVAVSSTVTLIFFSPHCLER